ncbi:MAG: hypothetical protein F6K48_02895 [Okeania sp. SIO3H1]|nr:hypothetical protein [Okeania sp. SIO3H1]
MSYYKTISPNAARELILAHRLQGWGRTFSVAWDRRTDSDDGQREKMHREVMTMRFGVKKHLKSASGEGQDQAVGPFYGALYDRHSKGLFCAFAISRKYNDSRESVMGYRSIPFDGVRWLKIDSTVYKVGLPPAPQH